LDGEPELQDRNQNFRTVNQNYVYTQAPELWFREPELQGRDSYPMTGSIISKQGRDTLTGSIISKQGRDTLTGSIISKQGRDTLTGSIISEIP
jgi:hypothetical protein